MQNITGPEEKKNTREAAFDLQLPSDSIPGILTCQKKKRLCLRSFCRLFSVLESIR